MTNQKEMCKEITRYFIGDVDDPRLDKRGTDGYFSDFDKCDRWCKELKQLGWTDTPSKVYTVKITLVDD